MSLFSMGFGFAYTVDTKNADREFFNQSMAYNSLSLIADVILSLYALYHFFFFLSGVYDAFDEGCYVFDIISWVLTIPSLVILAVVVILGSSIRTNGFGVLGLNNATRVENEMKVCLLIH